MAFKMNGWSAFTKKTDGKGDKDKPVLKEGPGRVKEKILKKHKKEEKRSKDKLEINGFVYNIFGFFLDINQDS